MNARPFAAIGSSHAVRRRRWSGGRACRRAGSGAERSQRGRAGARRGRLGGDAQPHAFLPRGRRVLRELAPDVLDDLIGAGADAQDLRAKRHGPGEAGDEDLVYLWVRRPVIEWALRRAAVAEPAALAITADPPLIGPSRAYVGRPPPSDHAIGPSPPRKIRAGCGSWSSRPRERRARTPSRSFARWEAHGAQSRSARGQRPAEPRRRRRRQDQPATSLACVGALIKRPRPALALPRSRRRRRRPHAASLGPQRTSGPAERLVPEAW